MRRLLTLFALAGSLSGNAQTVSNASSQVALAKTNKTITFDLSQEGTPTPIEWGMDTQWINEGNLRRGINFSSKEIIDILRLGFMPSASVAGGKLSDAQLNSINERAQLALKYCKPGVKINIGDDPAEGNGVDSWYNDASVSSIIRGERWARCIDLHRQKYEEYGLNVVSVSPFNEPDFGWNQGVASSRMDDFKNTARALRNEYDGDYGKDAIRICGGNTLSCDAAYEWWNHCKDYLDEGNTHQLAGGFDSYANFYKTVREAGHRGVADELHNVMEAMVGVEYGMQTGIWWGTATRTRGQFMKATHGNDGGARLAYKENRSAWTAASVYRLPDGTINGFVGTSERQCQPDSYRFVSLDRDVFYNGQGPKREFVVEVPGGYGYQDGQTNAETVIDITSGEDVPFYIDGEYKIVNVKSGLVLGVTSASSSGWTQITQRKNSQRTTVANWIITPVPNTIGEDFAYYHIKSCDNSALYWDIMNWVIDATGKVGTYPGGGGAHIEQWYFQYAGENNFFIRSRFSNLAVMPANGSTAIGAALMMADFTGDESQMWRLIPIEEAPEFDVPTAPTNLIATSHNASIQLDWTASASDDVRDYFVIRSEEGKDDFNTIGRNIVGTTFTDNTAEDGKVYEYAVKAEDKAMNRSERSEIACASVSQEKGLICRFDFEDNIFDETENGNHPASLCEAKYNSRSKSGEKSLNMSTASQYLQLPATIANHDALTISFWLRRAGTSATLWERAFDFGNSTDEYLFFTPNCGDNTVRFEVKHAGQLEKIEYQNTLAAGTWNHIVVTLDGNTGAGAIYINGEQVAKKDDFTISPSQIRPVMNYIGRSQFSADPLIKGYFDDYRIYNYALTAEDVAILYEDVTGIKVTKVEEANGKTYDITGRMVGDDVKGVVIKNGKKILK